MVRSLVLVPFLLLAAVTAAFPSVPAPRFAVAFLPTPVLNTPDVGDVFTGPDGRVRADSCGQIRALEFIALPGTLFRIGETIRKGASVVYRVTTDDYPYPSAKGYYIDNRFVRVTTEPQPGRPKHLPPPARIVENLLAAEGTPYLWGGNIRDGIPEMTVFFPSRQHPADDGLRRLRGLDCTGLLYEATGGYTPRNSSGLVDFGRPVAIAGLDPGGIVGRLEPLDLIVWKGHVMIVLDKGRVIESRLDCAGGKGGVVVRPLAAALAELVKRRKPLDIWQETERRGDKGFVVRRWYPTLSPAASALPPPVSSVKK